MTSINSATIRRAIRGVGLFAVLASFGCDDSSGPASAAGTYTATSFTSTPTGGAPRNEIAAGSTIDLVLTPGGTTSGHFHLAAFAGDPAVDFDLTGTWTIVGSTVDFEHDADTFIRDMDFTFDGNTLVGDRTFTGGRVQVTLTRD
jgi:hypothetical protein